MHPFSPIRFSTVTPYTRISFAVIATMLGALMSPRSAASNTDEKFGREYVVYAPKREYPYAARAKRENGSGVVVVTIDQSDGKVLDAVMAVSTKSKLLDDATLEAFRQWKFRPGTCKKAKIPIAFTMTGANVR